MLTNCPAKAILGDGKGKKTPQIMANGCRTLCLIRFLSPIEAGKEGPCSSPALSPASASPAHTEKLSGQFNLARVLLRKTFFTVNFPPPPFLLPPPFFFCFPPSLD